MPPIEDETDRAAMLDDFGVAVRLVTSCGDLAIVALFDSPTREISGVASELDFLEPAPSILARTESISDLSVEDRVEIFDGPGAGSYIARTIVAEEDGAFTRVDLAEA